MNSNEEREHTDYTPCWCNQWIPPTDEERVMFANAKKHTCVEFCQWATRETGYNGLLSFADCESIAESLALDGMDIEDVSKIEELMR